MIRRIIRILWLAAFVYIPSEAGAWGTQGHRITGQIADSYLNAKARAAIRAILGDESIAMASNWGDFIKSDTSVNYDAWHYIDLKAGLTYSALQDYLKMDADTDAYTRLQFLTAALKKKNLSAGEKLFDLRMLIHIAEDVHQPLHTRDEQEGGNKITVQWFSEHTNLHSVWDSRVIDNQQLSYTEYTAAINHTTAAQRTAWQKEPFSQWIFDSYTIATPVLEEITHADQRLSYRYIYDHLQTLNMQLLKGGVHLAGLLNEIFGK